LQIKKSKALPHVPKGVLKISSNNPNAKAIENYLIVKYLGQNSCAMLVLEVLQMCPSQRDALLSSLGALNLCGSNVIKFDVTDVKLHLPYHVSFQIHVKYTKCTIKHIVIDEGDAMHVMSLTCWKTIGSLNLSQYMTMLTTFDGRSF
jgi:hypothetical protein